MFRSMSFIAKVGVLATAIVLMTAEPDQARAQMRHSGNHNNNRGNGFFPFFPFFPYGNGGLGGNPLFNSVMPHDSGGGGMSYFAMPNYSFFYQAPMHQQQSMSPYPASATNAVAKEPANVVVMVPAADAQVWFGNSKTTQTGKERQFVTPPLEMGKAYMYQVRASWMVDGQLTTQTREVDLEPGKQAVVSFRD
jgi:uncharacterized protein (TIGR03000 family)